MQFTDRIDAGRRLAALLGHLRGSSPLVLGLPRGGVPVAFVVAAALDADLDIWSVRKVGAPDFPELGMGAVAEGGAIYLDPAIVAEVGATPEQVDALVARKSQEVAERAARFRDGGPPPRVAGRTIIVVDDGIATGGTARAALRALKTAGAGRLVLAVPVAASSSLDALRPLVDEVVCVHSAPALYAIGAWYDDFGQVEDSEVLRLLRVARTHPWRGAPPAQPAPRPTLDPRQVRIALGDGRWLEGTLAIPAQPSGVVLFAHGSGSSRMSSRNQHVAAVLQGRNLATLLFDLLTADEEHEDAVTYQLRFDIGLLSERLIAATRWAHADAELARLPLGYFGASTGAAAALVAAARLPDTVRAIVSRGGRPDLADESLPLVRAPTLLVVGGADREVLELNREAAARLRAPCSLAVVPRATHLFEEPGALDAVARLAGDWFAQHLRGTAHAARPAA